MKNLIEEIKELKPQIITDKYSDGFQNAIKMVLNKLNQYNIITAPNQITLSEIIDNIYETKFKSESWVEPIKEGNNYYRIRVQYGDGYWGDYEFYIRNNKIEINENDYLLPFNEFKWLYTLWIADTEIVDDLEGDDNE